MSEKLLSSKNISGPNKLLVHKNSMSEYFWSIKIYGAKYFWSKNNVLDPNQNYVKKLCRKMISYPKKLRARYGDRLTLSQACYTDWLTLSQLPFGKMISFIYKQERLSSNKLGPYDSVWGQPSHCFLISLAWHSSALAFFH